MKSERLNDFDENDIRLLELLSSHIASALQNISALEKNKLHETHLNALNHFGAETNTCSTIEELATLTVEFVKSVFEYTMGAFGVINSGSIQFIEIMGKTSVPTLSLNKQTITTRAVNTGLTQLVPDVRLDPDYLSGRVEGEVTLSELDVPIIIDRAAAAVINLESTQLDGFSSVDADLVEIMADHIASSLRNIRALEVRRRYEERQETLSRAMAIMNRSNSLEELLEYTLEIIDEVIQVPFSGYMRREGDMLFGFQMKGAPLLGLKLQVNGKGLTARAAREKRTILVNDTREDPGFVKSSAESLSNLAIPVLVDGETVGVLNMESPELGFFDASHVSLAEILAVNVASNLQRMWREEATMDTERRVIVERERAEQAEKLEEMKTGFIRIATHEIRTPLTSIKGYMELAEEKIDREASPDLAGYFDVIKRNTERLEKLSGELLDVQRINSGQITLDKNRANLMELVLKVVSELDPILKTREQRLHVSGDDLYIEVDYIRLSQVIVNLITNASKFSPQGSEIRLNIVERDDEVQVSVNDNGVGISETDIPKLFTPFPGIRVKGVKDSVGLGLSICRGLVELHGGRILAESMGLGKGSTFTFTLPKNIGG